MKSKLTFIALLALLTQAAIAADKPNVVIMLGDNVGYGDIGAYGAGEVRGMPTPRIDSIASQGLRLTQYLVEPACTPSRAALMTGRYSQRLGLGTVIIANTPNTLQANEVTLGKLFKGQGYATALVGKWHLGAETSSGPNRHGFDEFWGFRRGAVDYYTHNVATVAAVKLDPPIHDQALKHRSAP